MSIENMDRFIESLPDWSILDGCFGKTKIRPMDIDGCVERRGRVLFLEHKMSSAFLKDGQVYTFQALARQGNTVIVFWGDKDGDGSIAVTKMRVFSPGGESHMHDPASIDDLRSLVSAWYAKVDAHD